MVEVIATLAHADNNLVVNEILLGDTFLPAYIRALGGLTMYFVAAHCPLAVIERIERGDQFIDWAIVQLPFVHDPMAVYDLELYISLYTLDELATLIKQYIETTLELTGITAMVRHLGFSDYGGDDTA